MHIDRYCHVEARHGMAEVIFTINRALQVIENMCKRMIQMDGDGDLAPVRPIRIVVRDRPAMEDFR